MQSNQQCLQITTASVLFLVICYFWIFQYVVIESATHTFLVTLHNYIQGNDSRKVMKATKYQLDTKQNICSVFLYPILLQTKPICICHSPLLVLA